jgi:hypothetical protein
MRSPAPNPVFAPKDTTGDVIGDITGGILVLGGISSADGTGQAGAVPETDCLPERRSDKGRRGCAEGGRVPLTGARMISLGIRASSV